MHVRDYIGKRLVDVRDDLRPVQNPRAGKNYLMPTGRKGELSMAYVVSARPFVIDIGDGARQMPQNVTLAYLPKGSSASQTSMFAQPDKKGQISMFGVPMHYQVWVSPDGESLHRLKYGVPISTADVARDVAKKAIRLFRRQGDKRVKAWIDEVAVPHTGAVDASNPMESLIAKARGMAKEATQARKYAGQLRAVADQLDGKTRRAKRSRSRKATAKLADDDIPF